MQLEGFLRTACALPGLSGNELAVAEHVAAAFRPYADEVKIDRLNNVIAHVKGEGPKVVFCAHIDEIGLMVVKIEEDGTLRMGNVGGVDPRILPGMRVTVYGKQKLMGVIGAKAPHLLTDADRAKNYKREDLYIDMGLPSERVRELVMQGAIARVCGSRAMAHGVCDALDEVLAPLNLSVAQLKTKERYAEDIF